MSTNTFRGQTALITGASSGIGLELARLLAADGCHLILVARNAARLEEIATNLRQHHIDIHVLPEDLSDPVAPERLVAALTAARLTVDVLINNAGAGAHGSFVQLDQDRQAALIQLNVVSLTRLTRLLLPGMIGRSRGAILNVASTAGFLPGPFMTVYYASKAFVLSFSEALSEELYDTGVTVTCLAPGPTKSNFSATAGMDKAKLSRATPMDSGKVASYGYAALRRGKVLAIPGVINRISVLSLRLLPRFVVRKLIKRMNGG